MSSWLPKTTKSNFWDEEFFGMSSYTCQNFQNEILHIFEFLNMVLKWVIDFKKNRKSLFFWTRSSSGWVLTHVRIFKMKFQTFLISLIGLKMSAWLHKTTKSHFGGRKVLGDDCLYILEELPPYFKYFQFVSYTPKVVILWIIIQNHMFPTREIISVVTLTENVIIR